MPLATLKPVLLWSLTINYGALLFWVAVFLIAHAAFQRMNAPV